MDTVSDSSYSGYSSKCHKSASCEEMYHLSLMFHKNTKKQLKVITKRASVRAETETPQNEGMKKSREKHYLINRF